MSKFIRKQKLNLKNPTNKIPVVKEHKLTAKRSRFLDEYFIDYNTTQAAIRAGYSPKTAFVIGYEILNFPYIKELVQQRKDELKAKLEINQEWVLERYKRLTEYSVADFLDDKGNVKPLSKIPKDKLYAVCGLKTHESISTDKNIETVIREFKLPDKKVVLDSISRYLGMFEKDNEQKRSDTPIQINVTLVD